MTLREALTQALDMAERWFNMGRQDPAHRGLLVGDARIAELRRMASAPDPAIVVADELEGIVRQWQAHQRGGQHVGVCPNLGPTWIARFERWARELRGQP